MGTISIEHGDHLYWLGRYTERAFTTLKALQKIFDRMIDREHGYAEYLSFFGLEDIYENNRDFIQHFLYDKHNQNSLAFIIERAYDNGIVLREEISTEALSFLQLAKDTLRKSEKSVNTRFSLLPLEDLLYGFWGCIAEHIYDDEIRNIVYCGKYVERLDLYMRMHYSYKDVKKEYSRLCRKLESIPENTPYRYNSVYYSELSEILATSEGYKTDTDKAICVLGHIFENPEVSA